MNKVQDIIKSSTSSLKEKGPAPAVPTEANGVRRVRIETAQLEERRRRASRVSTGPLGE